MKHSLYILTSLAILTGCSGDPDPEFREVTTTTNTLIKPELTEEGKAEIAAKYGLEKPEQAEQPAGNISVKVGFSFSDSESSPKPPSPPIEVSKYAGNSEASVTALLGEPVASESGEWTSLSTEEKTPYVLHTYKMSYGSVSIMFIEGIAARIEAKPVEAIKYPDNAIIAMRAVGLIVKDGTKPVKENPQYIDFGSIDGYYNVRVGKDSDGDHPATVGYVKIVTESRFK